MARARPSPALEDDILVDRSPPPSSGPGIGRGGTGFGLPVDEPALDTSVSGPDLDVPGAADRGGREAASEPSRGLAELEDLQQVLAGTGSARMPAGIDLDDLERPIGQPRTGQDVAGGESRRLGRAPTPPRLVAAKETPERTGVAGPEALSAAEKAPERKGVAGPEASAQEHKAAPERRRKKRSWRVAEGESAELPAVESQALANWLGTVLAVLLVGLAFLTYVAARNDWLIDFRSMDQMIGVAFRDGTYQPRATRTVRVYELRGELVEEPIDADPTVPLRPENLEQSLYRTRDGADLLIVEGDLRNADERAYRRIWVAASLERGDERVATTAAPVGRTLTQEEFEQIQENEGLQAVYAEVAEEAIGLVINPSQRSRFTLVFPRFEGRWDTTGLTVQVRVFEAEYADERGAWWRVVYDPDLVEMEHR